MVASPATRAGSRTSAEQRPPPTHELRPPDAALPMAESDADSWGVSPSRTSPGRFAAGRTDRPGRDRRQFSTEA